MLIGVIAGLAGYLYYLRYEPSLSTYPLRGVAVSSQQGEIDWDAVKVSGVHFAYVMATGGGEVNDPQFDRNWSESARVGIVRGASHFFSLCKSGAEQAGNFTAAVPVEDTAMPPVVDLEFGGDCADPPVATEVLRELLIYLNRLERHYGKKPILNVTAKFYQAYLQGIFEDYAVWLRSTASKPSYGPAEWVFWQYHDRGHRKGIKRSVDLLVFSRDRAAFQEFIRKGRNLPIN